MTVTNNSESLPGLRERNRLRAMRRVQQEAVTRFTERGFEAVTVEEIAASADVSAMSVYRWFGTKEALVIWDEYDPPILAGVAARLPTAQPLDAVRDALVELLDEVYDRDRDTTLERTRLIYSEPALLAAADRNLRMLRAALARVFEHDGGMPTTHAQAVSAIATALLEVAIAAWQNDEGRRPLRELLVETFAAPQEMASDASCAGARDAGDAMHERGPA